MQIKTFAAIDIGSYEVGMKIFEMSPKKGMRQIDFIRKRIELGKDAYVLGKIGCELADELCEILLDFNKIMKSYHVDAYKAFATSAVREAKNSIMLLDQIRVTTGLKVNVISNSEQRFFIYKSIAYKLDKFEDIIKSCTAIVDVGGGSIQFSLYDKDELVTTQNVRMGSLRIRERLSALQMSSINASMLISEFIDNEISNIKSLYLKDYKVKNIIAVGDYTSHMSKNTQYMDNKKFLEVCDKISNMPREKIATKLGMSSEESTLLVPSIMLYKRFVEVTKAENIWMPDVKLSDGMAYDYAESTKSIRAEHNFENDIIAAARNIGKRYMESNEHTDILENIALKLFDSMSKVHGLTKRERLLLLISVILHDCGKYISLSGVAECSYNIIMATEIIGLSHNEREIIANAVKFNTTEFVYYDALAGKLDKQSYIVLEKLTAILRVANALDRSHKQKFKNVNVKLKDKILEITVDTVEDITLERGLFDEKADFFEEVYGIRPIVRQKKTFN